MFNHIKLATGESERIGKIEKELGDGGTSGKKKLDGGDKDSKDTGNKALEGVC